MLTRGERAALLRVADLLGAGPGISGAGNEGLAIEMRRALAELAAAISDKADFAASEEAVRETLDSIEVVVRGTIAMGNAERLPALLPGFVFLVALPVADRDRALAISRRCSRLIERGA